jgi:hypothetical protein
MLGSIWNTYRLKAHAEPVRARQQLDTDIYTHFQIEPFTYNDGSVADDPLHLPIGIFLSIRQHLTAEMPTDAYMNRQELVTDLLAFLHAHAATPPNLTTADLNEYLDCHTPYILPLDTRTRRSTWVSFNFASIPGLIDRLHTTVLPHMTPEQYATVHDQVNAAHHTIFFWIHFVKAIIERSFPVFGQYSNRTLETALCSVLDVHDGEFGLEFSLPLDIRPHPSPHVPPPADFYALHADALLNADSYEQMPIYRALSHLTPK